MSRAIFQYRILFTITHTRYPIKRRLELFKFFQLKASIKWAFNLDSRYNRGGQIGRIHWPWNRKEITGCESRRFEDQEGGAGSGRELLEGATFSSKFRPSRIELLSARCKIEPNNGGPPITLNEEQTSSTEWQPFSLVPRWTAVRPSATTRWIVVTGCLSDKRIDFWTRSAINVTLEIKRQLGLSFQRRI